MRDLCREFVLVVSKASLVVKSVLEASVRRGDRLRSRGGSPCLRNQRIFWKKSRFAEISCRSADISGFNDRSMQMFCLVSIIVGSGVTGA